MTIVEDREPTAEELAEIAADEQLQDEHDVYQYGIVGAIKYWRWAEQEAEEHEACLVAQFYDDPITRMASLDAYEAGPIVGPIRQRCAANGCRLCQDEEVW